MRTMRPCAVTLALFFAVAGSAAAQEVAGDRAAAYVALVEQAAAERSGPKGAEWAQRMQQEATAIDAAFERLVADGAHADALRLAYARALFLPTKDARAQLERALALLGAQTPTKLRADALYRAGQFAFRMLDNEASRRHDEESLAVARQIGDDRAAAMALIGLSRVALRNNDHAEVQRLAEEAMQLAAQANNANALTMGRHMLAYSLDIQGELDKAEALYLENLEAFRAMNNASGIAMEIGNLSNIDRRKGKLDEARAKVDEYLRMGRESGSIAGQTYALLGYAQLAGAAGNWQDAARMYGAAEASFERLGITMDPGEAQDAARLVTAARAALGEAAFETLRQQGRAETLEAALKHATGVIR